MSSNVDIFAHTLPVLRRPYGSTAGYVRTVAEFQQGRRGVLSTDNNFSKEGEEVRLVEMNDDVVAPSARASRDVISFLKSSQTTEKKLEWLIELLLRCLPYIELSLFSHWLSQA